METVSCHSSCRLAMVTHRQRKPVGVALQVKPEHSARMTALKKEMQGAEAELAKLKKNAAGLVEQTEKLQGQIENAGGAKMKKQKQTVLDLQQVTAAHRKRGNHSQMYVLFVDIQIDSDGTGHWVACHHRPDHLCVHHCRCAWPLLHAVPKGKCTSKEHVEN